MSKSDLIYLDSNSKPFIELSESAQQGVLQADRAYRLHRGSDGGWQQEIAQEGERFKGVDQDFVVQDGQWAPVEREREKSREERDYGDDFGL